MKSQEIMCPNCEGSGCIADAGYVNCTACNATGIMSYEKVHLIFYESMNQRHVITSTERREEKLRESVRRLVGEMQDLEEETRPDGCMADLPVNDCLKIALKKFLKAHPELSALIDGKEQL